MNSKLNDIKKNIDHHRDQIVAHAEIARSHVESAASSVDSKFREARQHAEAKVREAEEHIKKALAHVNKVKSDLEDAVSAGKPANVRKQLLVTADTFFSDWKEEAHNAKWMDYKFSDLVVTAFVDKAKFTLKAKYVLSVLLTIKYLVGYIVDYFVFFDIYPKNQDLAFAYLFFTTLSVLWFVKESYLGYRIYKTGDVSDTFVNEEAYRAYSLKFDYFTLLSIIGSQKDFLDKFIFLVYFSLEKSIRLVFIELPIFGILMTVDRPDPTIFYLKLILVLIPVVQLIISIFAYPYVRSKMEGSDLEEYCSYRIDKRISLMSIAFPEMFPKPEEGKTFAKDLEIEGMDPEEVKQISHQIHADVPGSSESQSIPLDDDNSFGVTPS